MPILEITRDGKTRRVEWLESRPPTQKEVDEIEARLFPRPKVTKHPSSAEFEKKVTRHPSDVAFDAKEKPYTYNPSSLYEAGAQVRSAQAEETKKNQKFTRDASGMQTGTIQPKVSKKQAEEISVARTGKKPLETGVAGLKQLSEELKLNVRKAVEPLDPLLGAAARGVVPAAGIGTLALGPKKIDQMAGEAVSSALVDIPDGILDLAILTDRNATLADRAGATVNAAMKLGIPGAGTAVKQAGKQVGKMLGKGADAASVADELFKGDFIKKVDTELPATTTPVSGFIQTSKKQVSDEVPVTYRPKKEPPPVTKPVQEPSPSAGASSSKPSWVYESKGAGDIDTRYNFARASQDLSKGESAKKVYKLGDFIDDEVWRKELDDVLNTQVTLNEEAAGTRARVVQIPGQDVQKPWIEINPELLRAGREADLAYALLHEAAHIKRAAKGRKMGKPGTRAEWEAAPWEVSANKYADYLWAQGGDARKNLEYRHSAAKPKPSVEPPKAKPSTVSHADTDDLRKVLGMEDRQKSVRADKEMMDSAKGHDPFAVASKVKKGEAVTDSEQVSMGVRLQQLRKELDQAKEKGDVDTWSEKFSQAEELADALDTAGSEAGRAMRARRLLIDDQFDEFGLKRMLEKDQGKPLTPKQAKEVENLVSQNKDLTEKLSAVQKELQEIRAQGTVERVKRQRFDRQDLDNELDDIMREFKEATSSLAGQANDISQVIATLGHAGTKLVYRVAVNYAKRGLNTLDDIVAAVQTHFPGLSRDDIVDVIANAGEVKAKQTKTDLQKAIADLKAQAKAQSPTRQAEIQAKIAEYQDRIDKGDFSSMSPKIERVKSKQVEALEAERDLVRKRFEAMRKASTDETGFGTKAALGVADVIRGTQLGFDLGAMLRQGLWGISHPKKMVASIRSGFKAIKSETALQAIENQLNSRTINGKPASAIRSKAGLYMADTVTASEEAFVSKLMKKLPVFSHLERFTTGFLNTYRAEMFDWFAKKIPDATEKELKDWARWVNSTSGRSNIKEVPDFFKVFMTSPRYTASRFEVLYRVLRSANPLGDRANRQVLKEAIKTAGVIYGSMKMMELAGAEVTFDPESSDFMKVRVGDTVYDPTAGIAPSLRLILRSIIPLKRMKPPAFGQDPASQAGKFAAGKASPVVSKSFGLATGSSLTGFDIPEDETGWEQWLPLVVAQAIKNIERDGAGKGVIKTLPEVVGIGANTYKKSPPKSVTKE